MDRELRDLLQNAIALTEDSVRELQSAIDALDNLRHGWQTDSVTLTRAELMARRYHLEQEISGYAARLEAGEC